MLILRVGGSPFVRVGAEAIFRQHGISGEWASSGREALELLHLYDYDLVLTDIHLPDFQAHQLVHKIRSTSSVPILILADATTLAEKIALLDCGADDVLGLPCDIQELLARIRAIIRRSRGHTNSTLKLGDVELRLERREVSVRGVPLNLSRREYAALELLFLKQGTLLSKDAFLTHLYCGGDEPEMKSIDVIICRLRRKLALAGVSSLIDTVWGSGYILRDPSMTPANAVGRDCCASVPEAIAA